MRRLFLLWMIFTCLPALAQAKDASAGSTAYVYESCKAALRDSADLKSIHATYCGAFAEGYFMGVMASSTLKLPAPDPKDPCAEDKIREFNHINNRFCGALPSYDAKQNTPEQLMRSVINTIAFWAEDHKSELNKPPAQTLGTLIQPGSFCEKLPAPVSEIEINPALLKLGWADIFGIKKLVSHKGKYDQCKADLETANGKSAAFKETRCGAEVSGFITGLYASDHVHKPKAKSAPHCEKPIERLYDGINPAETMCAKASTDPMLVAKVFVSNYELIRGDPGFLGKVDFFDPGALGAVGYETIYRGFLCRNAFEKNGSR